MKRCLLYILILEIVLFSPIGRGYCKYDLQRTDYTAYSIDAIIANPEKMVGKKIGQVGPVIYVEEGCIVYAQRTGIEEVYVIEKNWTVTRLF